MEAFPYVEEKSFFKCLDPRTKLLGLFSFFLFALAFNHPLYLLIIVITLFLIAIFSKALKTVLRFRVILLLLFLFSSLLWPLFLGICRETVLYGIGMGMRLVIMTSSGILFLSLTRVEEFVWALGRLGVPYPIGFAFSMALRFVPMIMGAASNVVSAQKSRGLDLETGNPLSKLKRYLPLIVPVFTIVIKNTDRLSMALEARGFNPKRERSFYFISKFRLRDLIISLILFTLIFLFLYLRLKDMGKVLDRL